MVLRRRSRAGRNWSPALSSHICRTCGVWYPPSDDPPSHCAICEDDRQYVPQGGQQWLVPAELKAKHTNRIEDDDGVLGIGMRPSFAIDQRCVLVEAVNGTVLWETTSLVTDKAVAEILDRGPVKAIAISHPHFYAAMHAWAEALDCPILLPSVDYAWVQHKSSRIQFWEGRRHEIVPGLTLIRCGGHFEGSSVLHWQDRCCPEGFLFTGDTLQVAADRKRVSAMHSYPNAVPLGPSSIGNIAAELKGLKYANVYGYTWGRNILGDGNERVDQSLARYLAAISDGLPRTTHAAFCSDPLAH